MIGIGIDTGGTYTDAVVVDTDTTTVLAKAKSLTTNDDLSVGIGRSLDALPADLRMQAQRIALSTTLATNACVQGKGCRAKLVIVGTTEEILRRVKADETYGIPFADVLACKWSSGPADEEVALPDWEALYAGHPDFFDDADAFAITAVRALENGGIVEKSGAEFLEQRFGKLVVKATDVAAAINVFERGATALLNARLVPVIQDFLAAIRSALERRDMAGIPVSIVRSDGSLMSEELARVRPVETILSGPAASVRGALTLAPCDEGLVVDIGGTTSDISIIHDGEPVRTERIRIGGWQTQVGGLHIDTIGLGGDSAARFTKEGLLLSPQRVLPLCTAASRWPSVIDGLETYLRSAGPNYLSRYEFFAPVFTPRHPSRYSPAELKLLEALQDGPLCLNDPRANTAFMNTDRLESEGAIIRCGMTPTDAMHILGILDTFDGRASELGARCLLKSYRGAYASRDDEAVEALANEICDLARKKLYDQAGSVLLADSYWPDEPCALDPQMQKVFDSSWKNRRICPAPAFSMAPRLIAGFVGIGAPTHVILPEAASALGAECLVPEHADVANAVGSICSRVMVDTTVRVKPMRNHYGEILGYRVSSAEDFQYLPGSGKAVEMQAREMGREEVRKQALAEANLRGMAHANGCNVREKEVSFTGAADGRTVVYEWVFTAHVEG